MSGFGRVVVGMASAEGVSYGVRALEALRDASAEIHLVMTVASQEALGADLERVRSLDTDDGLVVLVTLGLPGQTTLAAAHDEASEVEERIRAALPDVADVVVHTEP